MNESHSVFRTKKTKNYKYSYQLQVPLLRKKEESMAVALKALIAAIMVASLATTSLAFRTQKNAAAENEHAGPNGSPRQLVQCQRQEVRGTLRHGRRKHHEAQEARNLRYSRAADFEVGSGS